jgi:hypothetical protein
VPLALNVRSIELNIFFFFVAQDETFLKLVMALHENAHFLRKMSFFKKNLNMIKIPKKGREKKISTFSLNSIIT